METRIIQLGNIYNRVFNGGYAGNVYDIEGIAPTLTTMQGGGRQPMIVVSYPAAKTYVITAMRGRDYTYKWNQQLEPNLEGLCNSITTQPKDNLVLEITDGR